MNEPLLLTTEQVAELLQLSVWWVRDHGDELGRLGGVRPHRYLRERVEEYVRERAATSATVPPGTVALRSVPAIDSTGARAPVRTSTGTALPGERPVAARSRPRRVPLLEPGRRAA